MNPRTFVGLAAAALLVVSVPAQAQHRGGGGGGNRGGGGGGAVGRAVPRGVAPRVVGPRVIGPRPFVVSPVRFYRPYYAFRPRLNIGFGLWSGFPIAYSSYYGYYDPYYWGYYSGYYPTAYPPGPYSAYPYTAYPYPGVPYPGSSYPPAPYGASPYPYSMYQQPPTGTVPQTAPNTLSVQPGQSQANMGGLSFEIEPPLAEVFVDGEKVGTVADFTPRTQPLGLSAGRHRIEIRADGYKTIDFDVDIVAGQVIPYQGALER